MSDVNFVGIPEVPDEFLRELKANGPDAQALKAAVTEPIICDFSNIDGMLRSVELRQASEGIREQPPASTQRVRPVANFTFNSEELAFDLTTQSLPGIRSTLNQIVATRRMQLLSPIGTFNTILTAGTDNVITINQTGVYRIAINLNVCFYPTGLTQNTDSNNWSGKSNNSLTQTPVQASLAVRVGAVTRYIVLSELMLSKSDFELNRPRQLVGEVMVSLTQGNSFSVNVGRGPTMGVMVKNGSADRAEVLGFRKMRFLVPGNSPTRDISNYVQIYRIS